MGAWAERFVAEVEHALAVAAVPGEVEAMSAYLRGQFPFLGVRATGQRVAIRAALVEAGRPVDENEVRTAIDLLWARPEREYRHVGCDLAGRFASKASPGFADHAASWITADPWWDTCDALARRCVGVVVRRHPALRSVMDRWLAGDNMWLTRSAIIHMGGWRDAIDRDWVFAACLARAGDTDFFIRKAIGWILRDLAWVDAPAVVGFVDGPGAVLSNLSKREALKNVLNHA